MGDTPKDRVHVFIEGNVQDVHFRDNAYETTHAHDLTGGTRNLKESRITGVFKSSEEDVETMVEGCLEEIEEGNPQGDLEDFEKR